MRILHLTVHMGGGIGRAIQNLVEKDNVYTHAVVCLQLPEKDLYIRKCREYGISVTCKPTKQELLEAIQMSDICIIHWWGHPAMARLLAEFPQVSIHCILWCHVNGLYYPWISPKLIEPCKAVFFTSQCSLELPEWTLQQKEDVLCKKARVVYGIGDMSKFTPHGYLPREQTEIRVGYVGSFVKSKIHPKFVEICEKILQKCKGIQFILAGDPREYQWILDEIQKRNIANAFQTAGYVNNVEELLNSLDIFLYPLNPTHFATTENSILEAMAMKLPVVLFNQSTERTIITHLKDGILADDEEDMVSWVYRLAKDADLREQLGRCARNTVLECRNVDNNINNFHYGIEEIANTKKTVPVWLEYVGHTPWQWFLNAVRPDMRYYFQEDVRVVEKLKYIINKMPIFVEPSKGSIPHYSRTFPDNTTLLKWQRMITDILDHGE